MGGEIDFTTGRERLEGSAIPSCIVPERRSVGTDAPAAECDVGGGFGGRLAVDPDAGGFSRGPDTTEAVLAGAC